MKKVVHLTSAHQRYDQRILWRECVSLQEHGYDVTLIVNDSQPDETLENGIKILSTGFVPQGRWQRMTEGVRRVCELGIMQEADIYHLHDPELLRIALRLKKQGKKVIFDSHENYDLKIRGKTYLPRYMRGGVTDAYLMYEAYVCRRIDGLVLPSKFNGRKMPFTELNRFAYVNNYPRQTEFCKIKIPDYIRRKNVCYSGGLTENRGIEKLTIAGEQANVSVCLVGKFSDERFERKILNKKCVQYLGYINKREDVFAIYSKCAIGAALLFDVDIYGKASNLPTKVYEYMAMEMPVLISDFPYNQELIERYRFGLTANPSDVTEIAMKIKWLINHPKEAEEMGKNGKRLLEEKFTWNLAEKELLRLYDEIDKTYGKQKRGGQCFI